MKLTDLQKADKFTYVLSRMTDQGFPKDRLTQELVFAQQIVMANDYLASICQANANSVLESILQVVSCGLTLNPAMKQCYLVPFKSQVKPMPSYVGLAQLVIKAGAVSHINCQLVWEGDEVAMDLADDENPIKSHVPYLMTGKEQGDIRLVYAVATLGGGSRLVEYMSKKEVFEIRNYSETWKRATQSGKTADTIWARHEGEMFKKTVIKRLCKRLPLVHNAIHVSRAIELDNETSGYDDQASNAQLSFIESLLQSAILPEETVIKLEAELADGLTSLGANRMIDFLKANQQPRLNSAAAVHEAISDAELREDFYSRK